MFFFQQSIKVSQINNLKSWNCAFFNFLCSTNKNNINKHFLPFKFALFYVLYNLEETCTFVAPPPTHPTPPHIYIAGNPAVVFGLLRSSPSNVTKYAFSIFYLWLMAARTRFVPSLTEDFDEANSFMRKSFQWRFGGSFNSFDPVQCSHLSYSI